LVRRSVGVIVTPQPVIKAHIVCGAEILSYLCLTARPRRDPRGAAREI
jgi:hypothetical protein